MAKFTFDFDGLERQFERLGVFDELAPKILEATVPILKANVIKECEAHVRTRAMVNSIKQTKVYKTKDGMGIVVRPTGVDKNGVRNMEKMAHAEYGTSKQQPTPILSKAVAESKEPIAKKMQEIYNEVIKV